MESCSKRKRGSSLIGERFGKLLVVNRAERESKYVFYECLCDCGNMVVVNSCNLLNGSTQSCGCLARKVRVEVHVTHGDSKTRLYKIWKGMHYRCNPCRKEQEPNYAGRGISVCDDWKDYKNFRAWALQNGYDDWLTIDRIDVNGNYEPSNCRWANAVTQCRNKRENLKTRDGVTLKEMAEKTGIKYHTIYQRIYKLGWSVEDAVSAPYKHGKVF